MSELRAFQEISQIELSDLREPSEVRSMLKAAHLRPTRQRVQLGMLIFRPSHWHLTPDELHALASRAGFSLSLATVYNSLNQFAEAGLIRRVATQGSDRAYFDTDVSDHLHFCLEDEGRVWDAPQGSVWVGALPEPPAGYRIAHVDVVIRLARIPKNHVSAPTPSSGEAPPPALRRGTQGCRWQP